MSAQNRGWGPGWPKSRVKDMKPLKWITGSVHKDLHELFDLLFAETVRRGYKVRREWSWGYANRPIGNSTTPSNHSWGLAVDINAPVNPQKRPLTTDMPHWMQELWKSYGFRWGGDYTSSTPDSMHYEFMGTPNDAKLQTIRARIELGGGASQEADVNVVKFNDRGPRVKRAQIVLQAAGYKAGVGELLPEWGTDGHYGEETLDAVNVMAKRAGLDPTGDVGMDVLVLDYCRNWLSA